MSEARIGRVLVASLHQAIAEVLPTRLDFYEHWLHSDGLRHGGIGLAPMTAVVGFLRTEGAAYDRIVERAGGHAADWVVDDLSAMRRRLVAALPAPLRLRAALRIGSELVTRTYPDTRPVVAVRRGIARVDLGRSLFCDVRETGETPRCRFYAAAFGRVLELLSVRADAEIATCRATGHDACSIAVRTSPGAGPPA